MKYLSINVSIRLKMFQTSPIILMTTTPIFFFLICQTFLVNSADFLQICTMDTIITVAMRPTFLSREGDETVFHQKFIGNTFGLLILLIKIQSRFKPSGGHYLTSEQCPNQF